jgi:hypothetical protein
MARDQFTLEQLASEMARCVRRSPEFRKPPNDRIDSKPFRLVGLVDGYAIVRRPGGALNHVLLPTFDTWTLCDKEGNASNAA